MNKPNFWTTTKERINQQMQQHKRTRLAETESKQYSQNVGE